MGEGPGRAPLYWQACLAADDIPPMSHPMPLTNVTRPDEVRPGLTREQALSGAPAQELDRFQVPRILSED